MMTVEKETEKIENIETIKKAIEVEVKHHYIDIAGKKATFSKFVLGELRQLARIYPKNPKLEFLQNMFEKYSITDLSSRMKAVKQLVRFLKDPAPVDEKAHKKPRAIMERNPEDIDVMYVKGVGPKVGFLLN